VLPSLRIWSAFALRLHAALNQALVLSSGGGGPPTTDSTFRYLFLQVDVPRSAGAAGWMLAQIPVVMGPDQLVCDGKHSAARLSRPTGGGGAFISSGDALIQDPGGPNCQPPTTPVISRRAVLRELFAHDGSRGVLDPGDALIPETVFFAAHGGRGPTSSHVKAKKDPASPRSASSSLLRRSLSTAMVLNASHGRDITWILRAKQAPDFITRPGRQ